ncbi:MAG: hypothetical protein JHC81_06435 [Brevundimonas sp.]|uniref:hypothetical protein n=1 Tax=Brevundimonas sp. TaxID=1871086 RepID=UPI001A35D097|nr:hypothetical protein [Brevundimonas sp.]MBJ7447156.1 hypothetical protein [Brevundimonas sp.]
MPNHPSPAVTVSRNPGIGRPWAVSLAAPNIFVWRLYDNYPDAFSAARALAVGKLEEGQDFSVAMAQLPHDIPAVSAIEVSIELADALLAAALSKQVP